MTSGHLSFVIYFSNTFIAPAIITQPCVVGAQRDATCVWGHPIASSVTHTECKRVSELTKGKDLDF